MFKITTLNKISSKGLSLFSENYDIVDDVETANGILVRSQAMHDMEFTKDLMAIARAGAGVNNIPLDRCTEDGIVVFNTPGANANAVKELAMAGILLSSRDVIEGIIWTKDLKLDIADQVEKNKNKFAGNEIKGKTLGVIGLGAIGVMVANAATELDMKVLGYDPYISVKGALELSRKVKLSDNLENLIPECDYITIHVPFMKETQGMIGSKEIDLMKDGVRLLNFSRDLLVNEDKVMEALETGRIRRYVTDFPNETVVKSDKTICIPHLGASTAESEENCAVMAVNQMMDYLKHGNIVNSVNFPNCSMGICKSTNRIAVLHKNVPAMIGQITNQMASSNINISEMTNRSKGSIQYTLMDVDSKVSKEDIEALESIEGVIFVRLI